MGDTVRIPGGRAVTATLDRPESGAIVVACPPHPQHGGSRSDHRLRAVSDALAPDIGSLRFDYGPWDEGRGERVDAENALRWADERYDAVGLFGYSFGAAVALCAAAAVDQKIAPAACSALAPPSGLIDEHDVVDAVDVIGCPLQVVYGERDTTVDWEPVVDRARTVGHTVEPLSGDHHFVGQAGKVADAVAQFFDESL
jgi:alpha/beta superfamily hydrolase